MELEEMQSLAATATRDFNGWTLFWGFVFGTIGFWMFRQAKRRGDGRLIGLAVALLVYPYFVANPWLCFAIGSALSFCAYRIW
jgi:hypothetical protein